MKVIRTVLEVMILKRSEKTDIIRRGKHEAFSWIKYNKSKAEKELMENVQAKIKSINIILEAQLTDEQRYYLKGQLEKYTNYIKGYGI